VDAIPAEIRRLLDRVALYARTNLSESGRVSSLQVAQAYREVFEMEPEQSVQQVLMRLPGLSSGAATEDRGFIDSNFFDAAQGGTLVELIEALGTRDNNALRADRVRPLYDLFRRTRSVVSSLCAQVAVAALRKRETLGLLGIAIHQAACNPDLSLGNTLGDLLMCGLEQPEVAFRDELSAMNLAGAYFPELELTEEALGTRRMSFEHCIIDKLEIDIDQKRVEQLHFTDTQIGQLIVTAHP
jgi:hypothetical protein